MSILTAHNLGKYFGGQDVFVDVNLSIEQGARIALVGPNGEGKTTLLRIFNQPKRCGLDIWSSTPP